MVNFNHFLALQSLVMLSSCSELYSSQFPYHCEMIKSQQLNVLTVFLDMGIQQVMGSAFNTYKMGFV